MSAVFLSNLSSPPLLFFFFFLGAAAVAARSDLEVPNQIAKFLSLYLLLAIGFKGGVALAEASFTLELVLTLLAAMAFSALVPLYTFLLLRRSLATAKFRGQCTELSQTEIGLVDFARGRRVDGAAQQSTVESQAVLP